jgi:hypothetical protein
LPGDDVGPQGREAYFEDVVGRKGGDDGAGVCIDNIDPGNVSLLTNTCPGLCANILFRRSPGEPATTW